MSSWLKTALPVTSRGLRAPRLYLHHYQLFIMEQQEIDQRVAQARALHQQGCNCCQSVVLAFADKLPIEASAASNLSSPFGRGISGLRETCGCVTGMAMVCGLCGMASMVKSLAGEFQQENGDLNCARLLQQGAAHSCNDLVASAARILAESL